MSKADFIKEYYELCKKHDLYLRNNYCCCGSTSIEKVPMERPEEEYEYEWERYKEQIRDIEKDLAQ